MNKKIIKIAFLFLIIAICYLLSRHLAKYKFESTKILFFGIGKADSVFIESDSQNILIDTGEKRHSDKIIHKLREIGVKKIDYIVLTHPDKDHIGGAAKIMSNFKVGKVFQSSFIKGNKAEANMNKVIAEKGIESIILKHNKELEVGKLNCTIYTPKENKYKKSNDYSLVILVRDRKLKYLFTGDAEKKRLAEIIKMDIPEIDLLKVPHHGRVNELSTKLIEKLSPDYAVITNYNSEVSQEVSKALKKKNSKVLYTIEEDIHFISDGEKLKFY